MFPCIGDSPDNLNGDQPDGHACMHRGWQEKDLYEEVMAQLGQGRYTPWSTHSCSLVHQVSRNPNPRLTECIPCLLQHIQQWHHRHISACTVASSCCKPAKPTIACMRRLSMLRQRQNWQKWARQAMRHHLEPMWTCKVLGRHLPHGKSHVGSVCFTVRKRAGAGPGPHERGTLFMRFGTSTCSRPHCYATCTLK